MDNNPMINISAKDIAKMYNIVNMILHYQLDMHKYYTIELNRYQYGVCHIRTQGDYIEHSPLFKKLYEMTNPYEEKKIPTRMWKFKIKNTEIAILEKYSYKFIWSQYHGPLYEDSTPAIILGMRSLFDIETPKERFMYTVDVFSHLLGYFTNYTIYKDQIYALSLFLAWIVNPSGCQLESLDLIKICEKGLGRMSELGMIDIDKDMMFIELRRKKKKGYKHLSNIFQWVTESIVSTNNFMKDATPGD